jgi:putative tryptophan/tyrosine transport system substrate-binding protein
MRRRDFVRAIVGLATAWPLTLRAQQPKPRTIGYFGATAAVAEKSRTDAFVQRLGELGWIEGQTVAIEYRWAESQTERFPEIAAELVQHRVDIIVATSIAAVLACKQATTVIPIVFPLAGDPLATGLVASLARPGGNVTGLSNQGADLAGKRLEVLREVNPGLRRFAVLANAEYPGRISEIADIQTAARTLGLDVAVFEVRPAEDISPVFDMMRKDGAEALYVVGDTFMNSNRARISTLAIQARLPTIYVAREYVEAGGLMSYGANIPHLFARAAELVDKIVRGTKPSDIPVEQPTKFELVINLKTAKALGLPRGRSMRRREFITLLGASAWPLTARAQQATMPVIGFLGSDSPELYTDRLRAFRRGLKDAGYIESENVAIEYR